MATDVQVTVYADQAVAAARQLSTPARVEIAHQAAADARATAPVDTGEFRDSIGVETASTQVRIVDNDPDAGWKEYGTSDTPAHATLTNAARRYGRYSGMTPRGR